MRLLALIFGSRIYWLTSRLVTVVLRAKGVQVGKNFYIQGVPWLKVGGDAKNIRIGDEVKIMGDIDLRNREQGTIEIGDNVVIDDRCRLVAANDAVLSIGAFTRIGLHTIFNAGASISVGKEVLISGFCYVQSSNHGIRRGVPIQRQSHTYGTITIENGSWLGSHVTLLPGAHVGAGAVVGAKTVVTKSIPANSVNMGVPSKVAGMRP